MKSLKILLVALFPAIILPFQSHAQSDTHLRLGIKAGANFDQTQGTHLETDFSGYFFGGAYAGIQFSKVRVQAEALFSQNTITTGDGFKDAFQNYLSEKGAQLKNGTFKMNELSVPVLVGFNIIPKLLWIEIGPQYTAVVSIKDLDGFVTNVKDVIKTGYVSGVAGASVALPLNLNLSVRYVFGLTDRNNTDVPDYWRSSHIQASVGFSFL